MTDPWIADETSLNRRRFLAISGGVIAAAAAGGRAGPALAGVGAPKRGGTFNVARYEAIDSFTLDAETANTSYQVSQAVMEPLLRFDSNGRGILPGLAESYQHDPRNRTFTLRLAKGARFSNGRPVTARDVEFSVDQWKAGKNYGSVYSVIKTVRKIDDRTVQFRLANPENSLPAFLTWAPAGIIPDRFAGRKEGAFWQKPIGAGPFVVERWEAAGDIVLVRNPHYFRPGRPYLDRIVNSLSQDANQRALQFRSRQVDAVDGINPTQATAFPSDRLIKSSLHFTDILIFNTKKAPLDDPKIRRALAMAIDYNAIANGLYKGGNAEPPTGFLPPNVAGWASPSKPYFRQDLVAAKRVIAESGLASKPLQLIYPSDGGFGLVSQVVQRSLQSAGLTVKLIASETGTFLDHAFSGNFELAVWGFNAISPDIADPIAFVLSTNYCFSGYPTTQLGSNLAAYFASTTAAGKRAAVRRVQDEGSSAVPFLALDHFRVQTAVQSGIHGVKPAPWAGYYLDGVWKE
jgi:peptide/nickel transport system substrate-binding protein